MRRAAGQAKFSSKFLPFMKKKFCLETDRVTKNYQHHAFPCWWERLWLSPESSVDILKWQLEESLSVLHAITILGSEREPDIACKLISLLEVTLHKFSQSPGPPLKYTTCLSRQHRQRYLKVHCGTEQKIPVRLTRKFIQWNICASCSIIPRMALDWKINMMSRSV